MASPEEQSLNIRATEEEHAQIFDALMQECGMFHVLKEVRVEYGKTIHKVNNRSGRIDRVLIPTGALMKQGWPHGALGVELKGPRVNIATTFHQAVDYLHGVFDLSSHEDANLNPWGGLMVAPSLVFLFPFHMPTHGLGSILHGQRVGVVYPTEKTKELIFVVRYGTHFLRLGTGRDGSRTFRYQAERHQVKTGSR